MLMSGPARIGKDAVINETPGGAPVAEFPIAYDYGRRDNDGERPTQWVTATLWGPRAKSLGPHLKKGSFIEIALKDVHIETYESANGTRSSLKGRVLDVDFIPTGSQRPSAANRADKEPGAHEDRSPATPADEEPSPFNV